MRILHISETDYEGGAGKAAYALHRGLCEKGVESFFLGECVQSNDPTVFSLSGLTGFPAKVLRRMRTELDQSPLRKYPRRTDAAWSVGWLPRRIPRLIEKLRPDVIHLHWISEMLPIQTIGRLPGPIVWTHHDWGAFTGGCRCPVDCKEFITGCGNCPVLKSKRLDDLSRRTCLKKQKQWQGANIRSIAVGSGIAQDVRDSLVLGQFPCMVIPNGIDTSCFRPLDRQDARASLGLDPNVFVVLFGAFSLDTPLKGGQELVEALTLWKQRRPEVRICLITVGLGRTPVLPSGLEIKALGFLGSPQAMAEAYNAADVVVVPSRVESFGLMAAEAQACGIPVVAFERTGVDDIVEHCKTGYLVSRDEKKTIYDGLNWVFGLSQERWLSVSGKARKRVSFLFSRDVLVNQYKELYCEVMAKTTVNSLSMHFD